MNAARAACLALCLLPGSGKAQIAPGPFTAQQAEEGAVVFLGNCARCHGLELQGDFGPPLVGPPFDVHWRGGRVIELYSFVRTNMPADFPGTLDVFDYAAVVAFILSANGVAPGGAPLAPNMARTLTIPVR
jgi:mono/diheme cytochrome c family protein